MRSPPKRSIFSRRCRFEPLEQRTISTPKADSTKRFFDVLLDGVARFAILRPAERKTFSKGAASLTFETGPTSPGGV